MGMNIFYIMEQAHLHTQKPDQHTHLNYYQQLDVSVSVWLGSDVENSQYYGGIQLSASLYDYR